MAVSVRRIGIIVNGVTGRMGANQHLERSLLAIIRQGGIKVRDDLVLMPELILTGRNAGKLEALARRSAPPGGQALPWSTDLGAVLGDRAYEVFFDASVTLQRALFVTQAIQARKAVYCEKPTAVTTAEALGLARACEDARLRNGVVQDKLWLPGLRKLRMLINQGYFGRILSVQGEFGYWVFEGTDPDLPPQRPSWNYRCEDGGGMVSDMHCHWRYLIEDLFGAVTGVDCTMRTLIGERVDEQGRRYRCTADDSAYAAFALGNGLLCRFNSSWSVRVRRDDLLTIQVDGTGGSAVAGLRRCWIQPAGATPKAVWNPDLEQTIDFRSGWQEVPDHIPYDNAFKIQWELFLRHVAGEGSFPWTLRQGAKGVQLAELSLQSARERRWVDVPELP